MIDFLRGREKGSQPERLRESEVMRMLGAADDLGVPGENEVNDYIVGETVMVNDGSFKGFTGTIEKVDREKKKLTIMVKIFGRPNPLELDNSQVERE